MLLAEEGFTVEGLYGWFDRTPVGRATRTRSGSAGATDGIATVLVVPRTGEIVLLQASIASLESSMLGSQRSLDRWTD